ncbi:hypothetical protein PR003_g14283 [Phytophthora rubi]|uniref:Uncharacterized protein n=1 Tax=Phytophthora rubi TaxID=129364 RepID=A0A6A4F5U3_9STRA|nr:hypothetical protein PR002_g13830 [Phytophthora rubi]KAE9020864.1 hypothetical protein PR001_g13495 [Phytophthora rubi]KAE9332922.1 hypothetical protein PR003_g14283 [Phytophthora rubi]
MSTPTTQTSDAPAAPAAAIAVIASTATTATSLATSASVVSTITYKNTYGSDPHSQISSSISGSGGRDVRRQVSDGGATSGIHVHTSRAGPSGFRRI